MDLFLFFCIVHIQQDFIYMELRLRMVLDGFYAIELGHKTTVSIKFLLE